MNKDNQIKYIKARINLAKVAGIREDVEKWERKLSQLLESNI